MSTSTLVPAHSPVERAGAARTGVARANATRLLWLVASLAVLALVTAASLMIGSKDIPIDTVIASLLGREQGSVSEIVMEQRLPRTLLGLLVGAALGIAGALIQAFTRNPLADPGILGVNAGASFFVVLGVGFLGLYTIQSYLWLAFLGAFVATAVVYTIGSLGRGGATPVRLTLAGVALGAVLGGISSAITLLNPGAFDRLRFWGAGSLMN
ncbi:MAG: iron chelate uptake ABC transporter family permease subunit, partial [Agromyces sp.]